MINKISPQAIILPYQGISPVFPEDIFAAPGCSIIGDVTMGARCSVWFGAVVRGDVHKITIGEETNIQDGAVIHCTYKTHPTNIGNRVSIGHKAILHGCTVEDECLIGMGSIVMDGAVVGKQSIVAAGAVVTPRTVIPPRSLVMGSPGKVKRELTDKEIAAFLETTQRYMKYCEGYEF